MTNANNAAVSQACAACKYHRKKCVPDCPLAPFFPPSNLTDFLNAHKLFGVSNILKLLRDVDPSLKHIAMKSIILQSNIRANDRVGGCYRIICELQRQIDLAQAEFNLVLHQLSVFRAMEFSAKPAIFDPSLNTIAEFPNLRLQQNYYGECEDIKPLFDTLDDKGSSFLVSKCSEKVILKEEKVESVGEREDAAAAAASITNK